MDKTRVLIADDHTLFVQGMCELLASNPTIEVVGAVFTAEEAVQKTLALRPDIVLMDLYFNTTHMERKGIKATREILNDSPEIGIIVLTMEVDEDAVNAAYSAGARGYLYKGADQTELIEMISMVAKGKFVCNPPFVPILQKTLATPHSAFPDLNQRELNVLDRMASGMSNKEIAKDMSLSERRIRNVCSEIYAKLDVKGRVEAVIRARAAGLGRKASHD